MYTCCVVGSSLYVPVPFFLTLQEMKACKCLCLVTCLIGSEGVKGVASTERDVCSLCHVADFVCEG